MPNEVEETLRVLTAQIEEYNKKLKQAETAYDEFSLRCQRQLKKEDFDFISNLLYKLVKYYEVQVDESLAAKKEIMDKYDIPYTHDEEEAL